MPAAAPSGPSVSGGSLAPHRPHDPAEDALAAAAGGAATSVSGGALAPHRPHGAADGETIVGTGSADQLHGGAGADTLFARAGPDVLTGGAGSDVLIGGRGADIFRFEAADDSPADAPDVIRAGGGADAFQGAGDAPGDRIDLSAIDADATTDGHQAFVLGGSGPGHLTILDAGPDTLVCASIDDDPAFEFVLRIEDGDVEATAYSAADFIL
jgi:RTX calcium-binding nonapeptide repeat (4 copies)